MDNDKDMVEKAARYIFYIIYDETSLSGLIMALSAFLSGGGRGWGIFFRITKLGSTIGHRIDCHG